MTTCLVLTSGKASDGPYGVDQLERCGVRLTEVSTARTRIHRKIADVLHHRSGAPIDKAVRSLGLAARADIVLAFLEAQAVAPSWASAHGLPPYSSTPLTMMACWLADELRAASREKRRAVVRKYRGVDLTLVWSANQLDILHDCGFPREKIESIPFGFAPGLFPPRSDFSVHGPLVAVGSDRGRDYPTLLAAMQGSGLELDLICKESNLEGATVPSGVNFRGTIPYGDYRAALANAAVVAVPTKVMAYPTGQTVALEAAGSGACVVVTDTPAMREYFSDETAVMVPPHDPAAWRAALVELSRNDTMRARIASAGSQHVHSRFTYLQMWRHVVELWRERSWI